MSPFLGTGHLPLVAIVLGLFLSRSPAQLVPGDIIVAGNSASSFWILHADGTSTSYFVGGFGGNSILTDVLWDPAQPTSFLTAGSFSNTGGTIGRVTLGCGGGAAFNLVSTAIGPHRMSFDAAGRVVFTDFLTDQIRRLDPVAGTHTDITPGSQPWGMGLSCSKVHPASGDIFVGASLAPPVLTGYIQRTANGRFTTIVSGLIPYPSDIEVDPFTGDLIVLLTSVYGPTRLIRVNAAGAVIDLVAPGSLPLANALAVTAAGDFLVAQVSYTLGPVPLSVFRIPNSGGTVTLVGTLQGIGIGYSSSGITGLAVVGTTPCAAAGLTLLAGSLGAGAATLGIGGIPVSGAEGWTLPSASTSFASGYGPFFGLVPDALTFQVLGSFPAAQAGNPFHWTWPVPPGVFPATALTVPAGSLPVGQTWDLLALVLDAGGGLLATTPIVRATWN